MKALLQRVAHASVKVDGEVKGAIQRGVLILLGVEANDTDAELDKTLAKLIGLRIFNDEAGKMNRSCEDIAGSYLVISQFTLCADTSKGKRPSYIKAMAPEPADAMYQRFCDKLAKLSGRPVERGVFGADMKVELLNDGPVTLMLHYPPDA